MEKLRGNPLDMYQFTRVFGMTRVPAEGSDVLQQASESKHIALLRDGAIVIVPVYDAVGKPLTLAQLKTQLSNALDLASLGFLDDQRIENDAAHSHASLLTSMDRDDWAAQRVLLLTNPKNASNLKLVETALFCVSFDRAMPGTKEEAARLIHGGTGRNKWFDKSFNSVIFDNGLGGLNAEHTPVDAMTLVSLMIHSINRIRDGIASDRANMLAPSIRTQAGLPACTMLQWDLAVDTIQAIEMASVGF